MRVVIYLGLLALLSGLMIALVLDSGRIDPARNERTRLHTKLAENLRLTDLAIWNEARYTRHPSQADFFAPFQDGPGLLERFPSGTLGPPPAKLPVQYKSNGLGD